MFKLKQKLTFSCLLIALLAAQLLLLTANPVSANHASCGGGADSQERCIMSQRDSANTSCYENNEGSNDAIASCVQQVTAHFSFTGPRDDAPPLPADALPQTPGSPEGDCKPQGNEPLSKDNCGIMFYIAQFTRVLSGLVGVVVVVMIAYGGIQYSMSKDNPQEAAAAKDRIRNAVIALVFYMFIFAFLQYLIPGGLF
ncbi:hypothetical protein H0X10_02840 [Candidatus Saccharibacteria bacterium]|nr:hypothetical protein [Candidatus Saccharibacteria bacterium]